MRKRLTKTPEACRIGYIIRHKRNELNLSQKELGRLTGYSNTYLSRIENGYELPSLTAMAAISRELGLSMDETFGLQSPAQPGSLRQMILQTVTMMPDSQVCMVSDMLNTMHTLNQDMAAPAMLEDSFRGK
ncbi:MAG: helix-turn-helix transcriptional regulator [Firmicutes bacterium]|nr:helix-turn-helix transcriptional regulator [Bacillota bacterium]